MGKKKNDNGEKLLIMTEKIRIMAEKDTDNGEKKIRIMAKENNL